MFGQFEVGKYVEITIGTIQADGGSDACAGSMGKLFGRSLALTYGNVPALSASPVALVPRS
jgi:hypothetical protein